MFFRLLSGPWHAINSSSCPEKTEKFIYWYHLCAIKNSQANSHTPFLVYPCILIHACDCTRVYRYICGHGHVCGGRRTNSAVVSHMTFTLRFIVITCLFVCVCACVSLCVTPMRRSESKPWEPFLPHGSQRCSSGLRLRVKHLLSLSHLLSPITFCLIIIVIL